MAQTAKRMKIGLLRPGDLRWILRSQRALRERSLSLGLHGQALQKVLKANRAWLRWAVGAGPVRPEKL